MLVSSPHPRHNVVLEVGLMLLEPGLVVVLRQPLEELYAPPREAVENSGVYRSLLLFVLIIYIRRPGRPRHSPAAHRRTRV